VCLLVLHLVDLLTLVMMCVCWYYILWIYLL